MQVQTAIKVGQVDRDFVIQRGGVFQMADGYPIVLTAQQATFEMKNWDEVSLPSIVQMLNDVREWAG